MLLTLYSRNAFAAVKWHPQDATWIQTSKTTSIK